MKILKLIVSSMLLYSILSLSLSCKKDPEMPKITIGGDLAQMDSFLRSPYYQVDELIRPYFSNMTEGSTYEYIDTAKDETSGFNIEVYNYTAITGEMPNSTAKDIFRSDEYFIKFSSGQSFALRVYLDEEDKPYTLLNHTQPNERILKVQDGKFIPDCIEILDSVEVLGTTYYDVLNIPMHCRFIGDTNPSSFSENYWFAKDIGMIRFRHHGFDNLLQSYDIK